MLDRFADVTYNIKKMRLRKIYNIQDSYIGQLSKLYKSFQQPNETNNNKIEKNINRFGIICSFYRTHTNILQFQNGLAERILEEPKKCELYGICLYILNSYNKIERIEIHNFDMKSEII